MIYRQLGRSDVMVSAVGLGGVAFGGMYGSMDETQGDACLGRAIELGVNLVDTSPYYGATRSESMLGRLLGNGRRDRIVLCSKAGRNGMADFDFSPTAMVRSVEASLRRLRTDRLDILIAHDIEFAADRERVFTETAESLYQLKRSGKCRLIGMSGLPLDVLEEAIHRCALDVVITYTHYTLQNRRLLTELLPTAERAGVGIMNASPLCMGLLSDQGPPEWHPAPVSLRRAADRARGWCRDRGKSLSDIGMRFAMGEPRVACTISGAATADEMERNVRSFDGFVDPQDIAELECLFGDEMNRTWPSGAADPAIHKS